MSRRVQRHLRDKSGNSIPDVKPAAFNFYRRWYVVANRVNASIYKETMEEKFTLAFSLENPMGRLPEKSLVSSRPGRGFSNSTRGTVRHSLDRRYRRHEEVAKTFAKKIATRLTRAIQSREVSELVLVAEPHFLGLIRSQVSLKAKSFPKDFLELKINEVPHEYLSEDPKTLQKKILRGVKEI